MKVTVLMALFCFQVGWSKEYTPVPLDEVEFNRIANLMPDDELKKLPYADFGFTWEDGDASTLKWRPQGITTVSSVDTEYVAVSWYGRSQENYSNRGVRISFVNFNNSESSAITYRHVLLVDEDYNTFDDMHAGGLASMEDGYIHVPDSRNDTNKIYAFSLSSILYIPTEDRDLFYNYAYIMPRVFSYDVPIKPSFLSYDWSRKHMLVGTFDKCSDPTHYDTQQCLSNPNTLLAWYDPKTVDKTTPSCQPFFSEMQGALSSTVGDILVLWTSSSYGSGYDSHLHITELNNDQCDNTTTANKNFSTIVYPPGLEDLHRSGPSSVYAPYIWMLTEFGTSDGSGNDRRVFAAKVESLMP